MPACAVRHLDKLRNPAVPDAQHVREGGRERDSGDLRAEGRIEHVEQQLRISCLERAGRSAPRPRRARLPQASRSTAYPEPGASTKGGTDIGTSPRTEREYDARTPGASSLQRLPRSERVRSFVASTIWRRAS